MANKKQYSCWLLLILWVLQIAYSYVLNVRNGGVKQFVTLTETMQKRTDLHRKLLKTVNVKVHESNYNCKGSLEIAKVLKDSGEGWLFLLQVGASPSASLRMTAMKKAILELLACALAEGLFYINDIITSSQKPRKQ